MLMLSLNHINIIYPVPITTKTPGIHQGSYTIIINNLQAAKCICFFLQLKGVPTTQIKFPSKKIVEYWQSIIECHFFFNSGANSSYIFLIWADEIAWELALFQFVTISLLLNIIYIYTYWYVKTINIHFVYFYCVEKLQFESYFQIFAWFLSIFVIDILKIFDLLFFIPELIVSLVNNIWSYFVISFILFLINF